MKEHFAITKFGFTIDEFKKRKKLNRRMLDINYVNDKTGEYAIYTFEFANKGLFKTINYYKLLENLFREYTISQAIAFIINNSSYAWRHQFDDEIETDYLNDFP